MLATEKLGERGLCFLYRARITRADQITMLVDSKCGFRSVLVDSRNSMDRIPFIGFYLEGKLIFLRIHFVDDFIAFALCSLFPPKRSDMKGLLDKYSSPFFFFFRQK